MSTTALNPQRSEGTPAPLPHKPASTTTLVLMGFAAVYIVWGSTYLAIRIGIESFPPLILAGLRHTFVGIFLYPILRGKTGIRPTRANWVAAVITGTLLLFVGNGGVSWAEQTVPSGIAALLVATVSLWLVIVDWLRPGGVKPVPRVVMGLLMGFAGLALLVGPVGPRIWAVQSASIHVALRSWLWPLWHGLVARSTRNMAECPVRRYWGSRCRV